jgi:hypothetical protein
MSVDRSRDCFAGPVLSLPKGRNDGSAFSATDIRSDYPRQHRYYLLHHIDNSTDA